MKEKYQSFTYQSKQRFCSYWHQINEIRNLSPTQVLEIGIGSGFTVDYLRKLGITVISVDIEVSLAPDVCGSILFLPFADSSFPVVACFEVLEHLPYDHFCHCLCELKRVSQEWLVISFPDATRAVTLMAASTGRIEMAKILNLPRFRKREHHFDGEHYWEIGKKGYPLRKLQQDINSCGMTIFNSYRVPEYPYHRFCRLFKGNN